MAIVTERWDGMRWTRRHRARNGIAGRDQLRERSSGRADGRCRSVRQNRVDLTPQRSASSLRKATARPGADVPVSVGDGGEKSPILRGERDISRKAIAQGMSDVLRCPVCSCAASLPNSHTGPRVQRASGIPCSLNLRGTTTPKPRATSAAGMRTCIRCLKFGSKFHPVIASDLARHAAQLIASRSLIGPALCAGPLARDDGVRALTPGFTAVVIVKLVTSRYPAFTTPLKPRRTVVR